MSLRFALSFLSRRSPCNATDLGRCGWLFARTFGFVAGFGFVVAGAPAETAGSSASGAAVDSVVVALDGSGDFKTVQEAINAAPQLTDPAKPWTIRIKPGTYHELIYVMREKRFIQLLGEDPDKTIISNGLYAGQLGHDGLPMGTFRTPTVWIDADDFKVEGLTIANTAGAVGQAVALRVDGDRVAFRHCHFHGWQDTLLVNRGRHYFKNCEISGAIDFIFGGATAFFEACEINCTGGGYITAASTLPYDPYGFVFSRCTIAGAEPAIRTYLGRPWRAFASVIFLETKMTGVITPAGWDNWDRPEREKTTRYAEFASSGPGATPSERVRWVKMLSRSEAADLSVARVLGGADHWEP
jgi:pectinesterase